MRLLLCEDEVELASALATILLHSDYSVDTAYDGQEALDRFSQNDYDVIVLDIMMPKIDGLTVLKTIRAQGNNTPVLLLTAKSQTDDKVTGLDLGANDYLTKPFETRELLARIRSITRTGNTSNTSIISVGNISLNRNTFELKSNIGSFRLAHKEFEILEMLMLNHSHPIDNERFIEKIWKNEIDANHNIVFIYISYLIKKLQAINANVAIITNENRSYTLEEL